MYRAIARNNWKIDINNKDFLVEKLKNISYLRYNDYSKWVELTKTIIKI